MIAHIYPSVLQAVSGRGYAGCLDGCFQGYRGEAIQDLGYELPRIPIPRTPLNKGKKKGWNYDTPAPQCTAGRFTNRRNADRLSPGRCYDAV
jgi:hypothetical protein